MGWVEPRRMGGWILGGGAPRRRGRGAPEIGIEDDDTYSDSNLAKSIYVLLFNFHHRDVSKTSYISGRREYMFPVTMNKKHSSRILYIVSVGSIFKGLVFRFV
jgi:hypothetical protein